MKLLFLTVCLTFLTFTVFSQKKNDPFNLNIKKTNFPIVIDGSMDDKAWSEADVAQDFNMILPMDTSKAVVKTEVRMTYDDENIYVIAVCFKSLEGANMVESMRRDFNFGKNDNFIFFIDPFNDLTNGFSFGANAVGAQWDGLMFEGGKVDLSWDNKWTSEVKNDADKWVFEAAIPFKTMRYKTDIKKWSVNFSRQDLKTTEKSAWAPVPRQFPSSTFAYSGNLVWDNPPPAPRVNVSVIPYILAGTTTNYAKDVPTKIKRDIGGDAKIAVTSSLNLDITVNPDFAQVEVDRQQVNLDRFELFFPERRQFFLENGDLFANFGYSSLRPFFSRRVGLNTPILGGFRLSGKVNENLRMGLMSIQTAKVEESTLPQQNFSVLALQQKVFARSNIGLLMVNKESINYTPTESDKNKYSKYNRNIGLEYNLASANNIWTGKMFFMKSFTPLKTGSESGKDFMQAGNIQYNNRKLNASLQYEYVGNNYNAEVGFVRRTGYFMVNPQVGYTFFPKKTNILTHTINVGTEHYFDENKVKADDETYLSYNIGFRNRASATVWTARNFVRLYQRFDPTNFTKDTLEIGSTHTWNAFGTQFTSKPQSVFTYGFSTRYGGFYANGTRLSVTTELGYRFQPYLSLALSSSFNEIRMPEPLKDTRFWLVGPRIDLTLSNKLFFTTFIQYNEQAKNVNLNTRFQWRYKPASDLFIVYTDNYLPAPLSIKDRSLVLKLNYWWNI